MKIAIQRGRAAHETRAATTAETSMRNASVQVGTPIAKRMRSTTRRRSMDNGRVRPRMPYLFFAPPTRGTSLHDFRRKLPSFVRSLPQYYDLIRLLTRVHARRAAFAFPSRPGTRPGTDETSQVPRKELPPVHKVSDCARFFPSKPIRHGGCCLLFLRIRSAPRN